MADSQLQTVPFWAWLACLGAAGGMFRYLLSKNRSMDRKEVLANVGLGGMLGPSLTLMAESLVESQGLDMGRPCQVVLAVGIGGTSVVLFERLSRLVEWAGNAGAGVVEKKLSNKIQQDDKPTDDGGHKP